MSGDLQQVLAEAIQRKLDQGKDRDEGKRGRGSGSGLKGIAAGAGLAAAAPLAAKGLPKLLRRMGIEGLSDLASEPLQGLQGLASHAGQGVGSALGDKLGGQIDDAGGPSGILKDTLKSALPFGGGDDDGAQGGSDGTPGVGKGRRMPVQQSVDIGLPVEMVYNQFTQFELWAQYMHRVVRVNQEDDCTLGFATKIWGRTKEFTVEIETQRPDERIKWHTTGGMTHIGVVTFHELGPNLTRVLVGMDLDPGGMLEKMARGMRFLKRAVRADLHRFKALIETSEQETGAWRGVIEDGEVVKEHDASYDKKRDYADPADVLGEEEPDEDDSDEDDSEEDDSGDRASTRRASSVAASRSSQSRSPRSDSSRSGSSRSGSSKSGSSKSGPSRSGSAKSGSSKSGSAKSSSAKSSGAKSGSAKSASAKSGSSKSGSSKSGSARSGSTRAKAGSQPSRQQRRVSSSDKPRARKTTTRRRGATNGNSGTSSRSGGQGRGSGSGSGK